MGSRKTRNGEWITFLRTLALLQRLLRGPATAEELIASVLETAGREAYPQRDSARRAAFKHDRENLRNRLGVDYSYDQRLKTYTLSDPGPYGRIALSEAGLRGLSLLSRDLSNGIGGRADFRPLLDEIVVRLSPEARRQLENRAETISLDVRQDVDRGIIPERVWECVHRATEKHQKLSFHYASPRYENGQQVYYEVAAQRVVYRDGRWYLRAWSLYRRDVKGSESWAAAYLRFRLNYILDDEKLRVWPTVLPAEYHQPPRFLVHYLLKPEIGWGEISYHFEEMQITHNPNGSAEVRGFTDDIWEAGRLMLSYGEGCIVLGGVEVLREVERQLIEMARNYSLIE